MKLKRYIVLILIFSVFVSFNKGQKRAVDEYTAKAAMIYNFTKFIEWREISTPDFEISVWGESLITAPLKEIASHRKIFNKPIKLTNFDPTKTGLSKCQILFIDASVSTSEFKKFIQNVNTDQLLIVTENDDFLSLGSSVNFIVDEDHINFEINVKALNKSNLKASSQLLKLAVSIIK